MNRRQLLALAPALGVARLTAASPNPKVLRTPDERFQNLPDFPFAPHYAEIKDKALGKVRIHYLDEGPRRGPAILLLHGEPSWSYLYRKMIPVFTKAGIRSVAPDLVGFGRSDKPVDRAAYSYQAHVDWMEAWMKAIGLKKTALFCQDWGGLIGLRLVANGPKRFTHVITGNTGLPTGDQPMNPAFQNWKTASQNPQLTAGLVLSGGIRRGR
jgi:haloalkane dehalogenase